MAAPVPQGRVRPLETWLWLWSWAVVMMVLSCGSVGHALSKDKAFKHHVDMQDPETGQKFELHSEGKMAQLVELDAMPEVTRVACVGERLILKMNDTLAAQRWKVGQVMVGGPGWGCNATRANGFRAQPIYVKMTHIAFPLPGQVSVYHVQAGPFDMLEEANIHLHYDPGSKKKSTKRGPPTASSSWLEEEERNQQREERFRRSLANLVSNILNNVDWHANFSATIPFDIGSNTENSSVHTNATPSGDSFTASLNASGPMALALHKSWGQRELNVTRGRKVKKVKDDFVISLDKLNGDSELSYTFDLVIKSVDGEPEIVNYVNQFDLRSNLEADAKVSFKREIGVTYNVTLGHTPTLQLFRVPVVSPRGGNPPLPPVYLTVSYSALTEASVSAYSAGRASVSTAFNASGFVTASQKFDPVTKTGSDATSREWSINPQEQNLRSPYRTHVDFSVNQKLFFTSAVSWHFHDVDIELSPPTEITVRPEVKVRSHSPGVSRCVSSALTVDSHIHTGHAHFTADAFGLHLWDIALQPAMTRDLHLIDGDLGQGCDARCHGPSHVVTEVLNTTQNITPFGRQDPEFNSLRAFSGNQVYFYDNASNATWCGQAGTPCNSCSQHATDTSATMTCACRLMTSRLAAALTLLADMALVEWPDKRLMVLEAWDEATSEFPTGVHDADSLYKAGQALTLTVADHPGPEVIVDVRVLERLGQLAVCAGFQLVRPLVNESRLQLAVAPDGWSSADHQLQEEETMFWEGMDAMDVSSLSVKCASAPHLNVGDSWPQHTPDPALTCGPAHTPLHRGDSTHMHTLVQWNYTDSSLTFEAEGQATDWCGHPSRPCHDLCDVPSGDLERWNWCSTRMMTPRLAIRLRKLQRLAEKKNMIIHVIQAFTEATEKQNITTSLYHEGRAVRLTTHPTGQLSELASLAVCAGFDLVSFTHATYMEAFVKSQSGFQPVLTTYTEGPSRAMVRPVAVDDKEYTYPTHLKEESVTPVLVDGGFPRDTPVGQGVSLGDVMSAESRYFRLDPSLLECIELAEDDFSGTIEIIPDSMYRTRSVNVRKNFDLRHPEELRRFQTGQAMELRPAGTVSSETLLALATSVLRECPALVRLQMRAVGLGCHDDRIYVDLRPLVAGHERVYVMVWEEGVTEYCGQVKALQKNMVEGGPVVQSEPDITCIDRGLDHGLEFLSFQMGQASHCQVEDQAEFCRHSHSAREGAADSLQKLLTSAAGSGRLPRYELIGDIRACLVDVCGGCAGVGPVFDQKVRACGRLVHKYVERAASPFPDLTNVTTVFNTDTELSTVHALACKKGSVCVEDTPTYSLFVPTVTALYYPDPQKSLQRALFSADINPTPLLELVAQEMAFRAKGKVTVYIEAEKDIYALRNVLKVLMVYNCDVSMVEFQVAPQLDTDLITSSIQRKLEAWSGVACPRFSRFALTPFTVVTMDAERHRRSAVDSMPRNRVKSRIYNWEREWLDKMS